VGSGPSPIRESYRGNYKTSLAKIWSAWPGRLKATELTGRGSPNDMQDAALVLLPSVSQ
jgi:hypothetical protein